MSGSPLPAPVVTILLVCTGNICRSALAERLGRAYLAERLGDDAGVIRLVSAGTRAVVDSAMHPDSALVLRGYGAEAGDFRARSLTQQIAESSDLTLTMTRGHRQEVLRLAPRSLARTFTLREAADLLRVLGDQVPDDGATFAERSAALVRALADARSSRTSDEGDDVLDPVHGPPEAHEEAGEAIVATLLPLLNRFAALLPGAAGSTGEAAAEAGRRLKEQAPSPPPPG